MACKPHQAYAVELPEHSMRTLQCWQTNKIEDHETSNKAMSDFCLEGITRQGNHRKKGFREARHCRILTKTCNVSKTIVDKTSSKEDCKDLFLLLFQI